MVVYDDELRKLEIQNRIINTTCVINTFKYIYNRYNYFMRLFKESEDKNKDVDFKDRHYDFYKISSLFSITLTGVNGIKQELDGKQFDYVLNEIKENMDAYKHMRIYASVQFYEDHKFNEHEKEFFVFCMSAEIPDPLEYYHINFSYDQWGNGKKYFDDALKFFQDVDSRLPIKNDFIIKGRYAIQELCSFAFGYIAGTILTFILYFAKVDFIRDANGFALVQLLSSFIIGNILMWLYMSSLYGQIYFHEYKIESFDQREKKRFEEKCEYQIGTWINKKYARDKIKSIYNLSKKMIIFEILSFILIYLLAILVLFKR